MAFNRISSFGSNDSGYDSGIVEVFDEPARPVTKDPEHAKEVARQRQHLIASELSRRDADDYQQDMLEHMLKMEVSGGSISTSIEPGLTLSRLTPCLMLMQSTYKQRYNGS
jgi:hypothetical protein